MDVGLAVPVREPSIGSLAVKAEVCADEGASTSPAASTSPGTSPAGGRASAAATAKTEAALPAATDATAQAPAAAVASTASVATTAAAAETAADGPALLVSELLRTHAAAIEAMRTALAEDPLYEPARHDGLWLLRFLLSHNHEPERAAKVARSVLEWRRDRAMDEIATVVTTTAQAGWPHFKTIQPHLPQYLYQPDAAGSAFMVMRAADLDFKAMMAAVTIEQYTEFVLHSIEWNFRRMDAVTRRTGKITKIYRLIDAGGLGRRHAHFAYLRAAGQIMKPLENAFPQLLGALYLFNLPKTGEWLWERVIRPIMPRRIIEKSDVVNPRDKPRDAAKVRRCIALHHLPQFLGGECTVWPPPDPTAPRV